MYIRVGDGDTHRFGMSFIVGKGNDKYHPDLVIDTDPFVSVLHAAFTHERDGWYVQDMGTTNGTYLNDVTTDGRFTYAYGQGEEIHGPRPVRRGDKIRVGSTVLTCVPSAS
jgi:pSer/pThr/pTyr-binding forkhead associated (FHA) protein